MPPHGAHGPETHNSTVVVDGMADRRRSPTEVAKEARAKKQRTNP